MDCWETFAVFNADNTISKTNLDVYNTSTGTRYGWTEAVNNNIVFNGVFLWNSTTLSYDNVTVLDSNKGYFFYEYDKGHEIYYNWSDNSIVDKNDTSIDVNLEWVLTEMNSAVQWNGQNITWLQTHDVQDYYYNETGCPPCNECPSYVSTTYYNWTNNITWLNFTIEHTFDNSTCTNSTNVTENDININPIITFDTTQFAFGIVALIVATIAIFAEWKRDFVYFIISALLVFELGYLTLTMSELSIYISIALFIVAIYHTILTILYLPGVRDMVIEFREHLKGN